MGQAVAPGAGADGNFDGQITQADFAIWKSHFGQIIGSGSGAGLLAGATVPEPTSPILAISGLFAIAILTKDRRRC
jgi:hypothetical protein